MRISYDKSTDTAYVYFEDARRRSPECTFFHEVDGGKVNFDFDADGFILGVEMISASKLLYDDSLNGLTLIEVIYDKSVDAAFVHFHSSLGCGFGYTYDCDILSAYLNIDFDGSGKIISIETIPASKLLSGKVLAEAIFL